jgi:hypothetical protein
VEGRGSSRIQYPATHKLLSGGAGYLIGESTSSSSGPCPTATHTSPEASRRAGPVLLHTTAPQFGVRGGRLVEQAIADNDQLCGGECQEGGAAATADPPLEALEEVEQPIESVGGYTDSLDQSGGGYGWSRPSSESEESELGALSGSTWMMIEFAVR